MNVKVAMIARLLSHRAKLKSKCCLNQRYVLVKAKDNAKYALAECLR